MPIHFLSEVLSGIFALETYPVVISVIFAVIFLKQWSAGVDLLGQLDRATSAPQMENNDSDKGNILIKKRGIKARDLHGTVVLVVVSLTLCYVYLNWSTDMLIDLGNNRRAALPLKVFWFAHSFHRLARNS
jgi:hypothetical protein